jgi:tRNA threonylcarbamoyladenosine biosynthesis protein TsaB
MSPTPSQVLLAIDTSTRTTGLALFNGAQLLSESTWTSSDYHTVELAPAIVESIRQANLTSEDIGALGVATGPGSFTGLRIGLALAKGMSLVHHLPLVGVGTLDILAYAQPILDVQLVTVLKAGRGRLALGWYEVHNKAWRRSRDIEVCTTETLAASLDIPTYVCGELDEEERSLLRQVGPHVTLASPAQSLRRPGYLAEIAWKRWKSGKTDDPVSLAPMYLHYNDLIPG